MPPTPPKLLGKQYIIGLPTGDTLTGYDRDSYNKETTADIEYGRDEDNAEVAAIVSNPGVRLNLSGKALASSNAVEQLVKGNVVSVGTKAYLIEAATVARTAGGFAVFSLTLYAPDGLQMTTTP